MKACLSLCFKSLSLLYPCINLAKPGIFEEIYVWGVMLRKSMKCWNCYIKTGGWLSTLSQNKLEIGDTKLQRNFKNSPYVSG